jgi:histidine triad (HIT) family protein
MDCIFCKIIKGELKSYKVYEDEETLAFLDINPVTNGHILIVPKNHYETIEEISEDKLGVLMKAIKKVGAKVKNAIEIEGYNVSLNNGSVAGQIIPHLHFHIIPRRENDGLSPWPHKQYEEGIAEELTKILRIEKEEK